MSKPQLLDIELLRPHPLNPRLVVREEIVQGIEAQLRSSGSFDPMFAIIARPLNEIYQVVQGHHRLEAAKRAGLREVPCWVQEMTDDEAYMQLVLGNVQGELSSLEIGIHALGMADEKEHKDKLSDYAHKLGYKNHSPIVHFRQAARVFLNIKASKMFHMEHSYVNYIKFCSKTRHLAAIHKAPQYLWSILAQKMLDLEWSAIDTKDRVDQTISLCNNIPQKWQEIFLPVSDILTSNHWLSPRAAGQLVALAEGMTALIHSYKVDHNKFEQKLQQWLSKGIGGYAWDVRRLVDYQRRLQKRLAEDEREPPTIELENYWAWLSRQPDCDLLLTDPPYMTDVDDIDSFASEWLPLALSKIKTTGRAYIFIGAYPDELKAYLNVEIPNNVVLANILVWTYQNTLGPCPSHDYKLNWQAILYYKGVQAKPLNCPIMTEQFTVQNVSAPDGRLGKRYHTWQKPDTLAERLIMHSTNVNDTIWDPFAGTGTFLLAASGLGRIAKGCDNNKKMIEIAVERGCACA